MTRGERWTYACLATIGVALTLAFGAWWFAGDHVPNNFPGWLHAVDIAMFILLSYVVWFQIGNELFSWYIAAFMRHPRRPYEAKPGLRVALLTAFVPGKEPYDVLERTLNAMVSAEYPHDTWILDEGDDAMVKNICRRLGAKHFSRKGKPPYNTTHGKFKAKTKGGNYNAWFADHGPAYDIVAQHDVDFVPHTDFLTKTLGYFSDPDVAFVGTPQIYGNKDESWIARGAAEQAYGFYGHMQKGLYGHDMSLFIGANHVVRMAAHNQIEGYAGHIVEDHLTGMKFYAKRWKSVYVPEVLAVGEGPATWDAYFSQQMRWAYGLIDILLRHSPALFTRMKTNHIVNYFILQQTYFYGLAQAIGIFLISLYFAFGFEATSMNFKPLLVLYVPLLAWQIVMFFWLQRFNVDLQEERGFLWRGRILTLAAWPIYVVAFLSALVGRKLTYAVTPKGKAAEEETSPALFLPHAILGAISAVGIWLGTITGHDAPQILFWAIVNTATMYGLVCMVLWPTYIRRMKAIVALATLPISLRSILQMRGTGFKARPLYMTND